MKLKWRVVFSVFLVFIFYVSYKILEPELHEGGGRRDDGGIYDKVETGNSREFDSDIQEMPLPYNASRGVREKYLLQMYDLQWDRPLKEDPWKVAESWVTHRQVHPDYIPELGAILKWMSVATIQLADVGYKGTQLKMLLQLQGNIPVAFKPKWFGRDEIIPGKAWNGADRHFGEIAGFHLNRILGLNKVPLVVGRTLDLKEEIMPVAKKELLKTFYTKGANTCFYGKCLYCKNESTGVCGEGEFMEGAIVLWLPTKYKYQKWRHPYQRTYKEGKSARWEEDDSYCSLVVKQQELFQNGPRLGDILDAAVYDYLILNADRHHYETMSEPWDSMLVMFDSGKSFASPHYDEESILAPLTQCCVNMVHRYHLTVGGHKKIVTVQHKNDLIDEIRRTFGIEEGGQITLQQWDDEYKDMVDVEGESVPDSGKLCAIVTTVATFDITDGLQTSTPIHDVTDDSTNETMQMTISPGHITWEPWPVRFQLPINALSKATIQELTGTQKMPSSGAWRGLLELVYNTASNYTLYPTPSQYTSMLDAIIQEWPNLIQVPGLSSADAKVLWKTRLRHKFINNRRRKDASIAKQLKLPAATKTTTKTTNSDPVHSKTEVTAYGIKNYLPCSSVTQSEDVVKEHIKWLKDEKVNHPRRPNNTLVRTLMDQTFIFRRRAIVLSPKPVKEVLFEYPWLGNVDELQDEYNRLTETDIVLKSDNYMRQTAQSVVQSALELRRKDKHVGKAIDPVLDLVAEIDYSNLDEMDDKTKRALVIACFLCAPLLLKEKIEDIIGPEVPSDTPVFMRIPSLSDLIEKMKIEVVCEGDFSFETLSFPQAMRVYLALHYVFNLEYAKSTSKSMMFFEKAMLGIENKNKRPKEQTVINMIAKLSTSKDFRNNVNEC